MSLTNICNAVDALRYWNRHPRDGGSHYLDETSQVWKDLVDLLHDFTATAEELANAYSTGRADAEVEYEESQ